MKKIILCFVVLLDLTSCSDQLTESESSEPVQPVNQVDDKYQYYLEKARWGDGDACMKLADYYRRGAGAKPDFIGMVAMLSLAEQYNHQLSIKDYMGNLPEDDDYRLLLESFDKVGTKKNDEGIMIANKLISNGCLEGHVMLGAMRIERGDTLGGIQSIELAAGQGSTFGKFAMCMLPSFISRRSQPFDVGKMKEYANEFPYANKFLGDLYAGYECDSVCNEEFAAQYYWKADEFGFLCQKGAMWLLDYYMREHKQMDEQTKQRLLAICRGQNEEVPVDEEVPIVYQEQSIQEYVDSVTYCRMLTDKCKRAIVYVVETKTGKVISHSSLEDTGNYVIPFEDSFNKENDYIQGAATYLAVQWLGNITPNTMIDTGHGVYEAINGKLIKDHNWRRGGYGEISLEYALTHRSEVGLTKAIEMAYKNDRKAYEHQINFYLNSQPDNLMGMLTFYNAIANGGKMVKICGPEEDATIIHDQICYPEYIEPVQRAMERCVTDGIYKKAGNEYTDVAACGRTLRIEDTRYRMELCGYFPTKNPQYTIMVVMEKNGLPASAGGVCGPLFSQIVVGLLPELG